MANETIKVLLTLILFGGLRAAIFVTEMRRAQVEMRYRKFLDWVMPMVWPAKYHRHA